MPPGSPVRTSNVQVDSNAMSQIGCFEPPVDLQIKETSINLTGGSQALLGMARGPGHNSEPQ